VSETVAVNLLGCQLSPTVLLVCHREIETERESEPEKNHEEKKEEKKEQLLPPTSTLLERLRGNGLRSAPDK
jgi:hypothetical protein